LEVEDAVELIKSAAAEVFPSAKVVAAMDEGCAKVAIDSGDVQVFISVIPGSARGVVVAKFVKTPFLGCSEAFMVPEGLIAVIASKQDREKITRKLRAVASMPQARA